jgi:excisionase family DNA binding protein
MGTKRIEARLAKVFAGAMAEPGFLWARRLSPRLAPKEKETVTPKALTVKGAADYLSCSVKHIRRLIWKRELRYVKAGRRFVIATEELDRWLRESQRHA